MLFCYMMKNDHFKQNGLSFLLNEAKSKVQNVILEKKCSEWLNLIKLHPFKILKIYMETFY